MKEKWRGPVRGAMLVLLLFSLGAAAFATYLPRIQESSSLWASSAANGEDLDFFESRSEPAADAPVCYTIDASRPEWLVGPVYLPLNLKDYYGP